nr:NAD(P)-dependent oxidoreductase [Psychrobacter proteolyticus]
MAKQPLIVNVARGGIVDSAALSDAVNAEQIIGYATDVFEQEARSLTMTHYLSATIRVLSLVRTMHGAAKALRKPWADVKQTSRDFHRQPSSIITARC